MHARYNVTMYIKVFELYGKHVAVRICRGDTARQEQKPIYYKGALSKRMVATAYVHIKSKFSTQIRLYIDIAEETFVLRC